MATKKTTAMKKKSSTKRSRSAKITIANRYLRYELTNSATPGTETSHFIDLARDLSIVNRRLMRQGRMYHVKKITVVSSNTLGIGSADPAQRVDAGFVSASVIHPTWVSQGAWQRGMKTWQLMNKEATSNLTNDISAKWQDFKVFMSNDHRASSNVLRPLDNGGIAAVDGEWTYTILVSPDGTTGADPFSIHMLGANQGSVGAWTSVGLINSYAATRATVDNDQPNVPGIASDDPLLNVFDYGTTVDEVIDRLETENDNPPYDATEYPGGTGNMAKPSVAQMTTLGTDGKATLAGFSAMCGLVEIESKSPIASDVYNILVELAPGSYRGIKADVI